MLRTVTAAVVFLSFFAMTSTAHAQIFSDNFNSGAAPQWGNERGNWAASGGVYSAGSPNANVPLTYSSLPYVLSDFVFDADINQVADGGIWLHSDAAGQNGVVLITGGNGWGGPGPNAGHTLYFQIMQSGAFGPEQGLVTNVFANPGVQNTHIHVTVVGNVYTATASNTTTGTTTTSVTTSLFPTGRVGLYDSSIQTFDNVVLTPEPASILLLGSGGLLLLRRRRRA